MILSGKTTSGIFWVTFSNILLKVINFVVNFFEIFRDMGIGTALIHKKEPSLMSHSSDAYLERMTLDIILSLLGLQDFLLLRSQY